MQLVLIVPGLLAMPTEELAAMRSLATLARYTDAPRVAPHGITAALFAALGVASDAPAAPLAMLGSGSDPGNDYILCADPVHLAADRDTVVLVQAIDDLAADEAHALIQMLNGHFAQDDLRFEAPRPDAWFARRTHAAEIETTPLDAALRRNLFGQLPRGSDAGRWKRWQNEIEMLLHEHDVNAKREARGQFAVSGVWFWGGGRRADVPALPPVAVTAAPGRFGDIARGIARHAHGETTTWKAEDDATRAVERAAALAAHAGQRACALVVLPAMSQAATGLEAKWLAPALDLLVRRDVEALQLIADGNGNAATWVVHAPKIWQRLSALVARRRFEAPAVPDA